MNTYGYNKRGRKSIPKELLGARREYIAGLRSAGVNNPDIRGKINDLAEDKGWGEVTLRTIERDIAKFYKERDLLTPQDYEDFFCLREANLAQLELIIEKMSVYIIKKKNWQPFEHANALSKLFKMMVKYMELQNWNYSKKNMDFDFRHRKSNHY